MSLLMNILWILLGGICIAVEYIVASIGMMVTIIGIPFGIQTLKLSLLALCSFGRKYNPLRKPADVLASS